MRVGHGRPELVRSDADRRSKPTQNPKHQSDIDRARKSPGTDKEGNPREARPLDRGPVEGSRFDKERQDRDRSTFESQNQGHGPSNVGDQSRTR